MPQDDSLWSNINGSSRDDVSDKRSYNSAANLPNAEQSTQLSAMTQRTRQGCRFIPLTFPAELLKFFKGKKEELFPSTQGIANSTWDLKTELFAQNLTSSM